jgi:hypothetical protein
MYVQAVAVIMRLERVCKLCEFLLSTLWQLAGVWVAGFVRYDK